MQLCAKGHPNRIPNGREKREQTHTHTDTHFRIYISRDYVFTIVLFTMTGGTVF